MMWVRCLRWMNFLLGVKVTLQAPLYLLEFLQRGTRWCSAIRWALQDVLWFCETWLVALFVKYTNVLNEKICKFLALGDGGDKFECWQCKFVCNRLDGKNESERFAYISDECWQWIWDVTRCVVLDSKKNFFSLEVRSSCGWLKEKRKWPIIQSSWMYVRWDYWSACAMKGWVGVSWFRKEILSASLCVCTPRWRGDGVSENKNFLKNLT